MAQLAVLMAGLLLITDSEASDVAHRYTSQDFLSKYTPSKSDASKSSMSHYDKFMLPKASAVLNEFPNRNNPDLVGPATDAIQHMNMKKERGDIASPNMGARPFTIVDGNQFFHPATGAIFNEVTSTAAKKEPSMSTRNFDHKRSQIGKTSKLFRSSMIMTAIGVGLLTLVTMLGVRMRRVLQPASGLASSSGLGDDLPMIMESALGDSVMEMKSQDSQISHHDSCSAATYETIHFCKDSSTRNFLGQLSSQNSHQPTACFATSPGKSTLTCDIGQLYQSRTAPPLMAKVMSRNSKNDVRDLVQRELNRPATRADIVWSSRKGPGGKFIGSVSIPHRDLTIEGKPRASKKGAELAAAEKALVKLGEPEVEAAPDKPQKKTEHKGSRKIKAAPKKSPKKKAPKIIGNIKNEVQHLVQRELNRPVTRADIVWSSRKDSGGKFIGSVSIPYRDLTIEGNPRATKKGAELAAARTALVKLGELGVEAAPQKLWKIKRDELRRLVQREFNRRVTRADIVWSFRKDSGGKFIGSVSIPHRDLTIEGKPCATREDAYVAAAEKALIKVGEPGMEAAPQKPRKETEHEGSRTIKAAPKKSAEKKEPRYKNTKYQNAFDLYNSTKKVYDYFAIVDFECTCDDSFPRSFWENRHEIIEFPVVFLNARTLEVDFEFHRFVRPTERPTLSAYCTKLTGIGQAQVDAADTLDTVLHEFHEFLHDRNLSTSVYKFRDVEGHQFVFCTDGRADLRNFLRPECRRKSLPLESYWGKFVDIKRNFCSCYNIEKQGTIESMLAHQGLELEGKQHNGLDDARNISRIAVEMIKNRHRLEISNSIGWRKGE